MHERTNTVHSFARSHAIIRPQAAALRAVPGCERRRGGRTRTHPRCALRSPATLSLALSVPLTATGDGATSRAGAAAECDCCCAAGRAARTPLNAAVAAMAADLHPAKSMRVVCWLSCWCTAWAVGQVGQRVGDGEY